MGTGTWRKLNYFIPLGSMLALIVAGVWATVQFWDRPDASAWIQCIWSIVAVFLAIIAPMWHAAAAAESEYRRTKALLGQIVVAAELLCDAVIKEEAIPQYSAPFYHLFNVGEWESVRDSLAAFPVTTLHSADELRDLMAVRAAMDQAVTWVRRTHAGNLLPHGAQENLKALMGRARVSFQRLRE